MRPVIDGFPWITDNLSLVFDKTGVHLLIAVLALLISIAIATPVGVWLGHVHRGGFAAINISNVGRALPSLQRPRAFVRFDRTWLRRISRRCRRTDPLWTIRPA